MRLYDILEPIAEYVRKAKKRETLTASGTVPVKEGQLVTMCALSLKPNREYLVIGGSDLRPGFSSGSTCQAALVVSENAEIAFGNYSSRTVSNGGGGCVTSMYVKTADTKVNVDLLGYGYSPGTYGYRGSIIAIEI